MVVIKFADSEQTYGILNITKEVEIAEIQHMKVRYIKGDPDNYNMDEFIEYLESHGYVVTQDIEDAELSF